MGKQGTITSFFRPVGSQAQTSSSNTKASKSSAKKRPRQKPSSDDAGLASAASPASSSSNHSLRSDEKRLKTALSSPEIAGADENPTVSRKDDGGDDRQTSGNSKISGEKIASTRRIDINLDGSTPTRKSSAEADTTIQTKPELNTKSSFSVPDTEGSRSPFHSERTWKKEKPVPYKYLADAFAKVEALSGRLEIQAILSEVFRNIIASTPEDLVPAIYLSVNKLAPAHEGVELGIGESILLKSLSQVTGRSVGALKAAYKNLGDLGDVAAASRTTQKTMFPPPPLTIKKVFAELRAIAGISGKNTQDSKQARVIKMLVAASKQEAKYISRALLGKLRINLADKTVIAALAAAIVMENENVDTKILLSTDGKKKGKLSQKEEDIEDLLKAATNILNRVYGQLPVWDLIIPKLLEYGTIDDRLEASCKLVPGVPVAPMLAKPTKAISEVLERFSESCFTCEYKYDGERAQIHRLSDGTMKIYSRNAENLTPKYPDLVMHLPNALHNDYKKASFIVDGEVVAYDTEKKQILPFQELQSRKRKDVSASDITVTVCIFAFDLLFFDGVSLIEATLKQRRERLQEGFVEQEGQFMFAKGHDSRDPEQIMDLLNASIKAGCEGLMVKALKGENSTYEPANRSQNWLKVKKDYLEGCGDSLDLVPIGGYLGRGKRTGTYGAFLLACYDADTEEYQSICKIGTGFSEAALASLTEFFNDDDEGRRSERQKSYYKIPGMKTLEPDVWFEPVQVWEVKCADLSISPQHTAAIGLADPDKGVALRFPRFLRVRDDKKPEEATSAEQVAEMYMQQSAVVNNV